jgi:HK97 family phage major capsid protein
LENEIKAAFEELRELWESEFKRLDGRSEELDRKLTERMDALDSALQAGGHEVRYDADGVVEQRGPFLGLEAKAAPHFGLERPDYALDEVRVGAMIAAMAGGESVAANLNDAERKSLLESSGPAGGYLLPPVLGAMFLDAVRPRTRVLEAEAQTLPMRAAQVRIPGWDESPSASWRGESKAFADAGGTFRRIELSAKMVAAERELSIEMLEDSGSTDLGALSNLVEAEIGAAIAEAIDKASATATFTRQATGVTRAGNTQGGRVPGSGEGRRAGTPRARSGAIPVHSKMP